MREELEQDLLLLTTKYSADRVKISTVNFDLDYQRGQDGQLRLKSEKAVIRALGKITKVPLGEGHEFSTFEDAEAATKKYWQEYYKKVRAKRSDEERVLAAKRQKRYRERKKAQATEFKQQQ